MQRLQKVRHQDPNHTEIRPGFKVSELAYIPSPSPIPFLSTRFPSIPRTHIGYMATSGQVSTIVWLVEIMCNKLFHVGTGYPAKIATSFEKTNIRLSKWRIH